MEIGDAMLLGYGAGELFELTWPTGEEVGILPQFIGMVGTLDTMRENILLFYLFCT